MPSFQLSEQLLCTPLFQGISKGDLQDIVGNTKFGFYKFDKARVIAKAGQPCKELLFLLNGDIEMITSSVDESYTVTEYLSAPFHMQAERLFGLNQTHSSTIRASTPCNIMSLSKTEVINLYNNYEVFRINLLNILSTCIQKKHIHNWASAPVNLEERIKRFLVNHCNQLFGKKVFKMKMTDLAQHLNDSRINVSAALNKLEAQSLLILSRGAITIPEIRKLVV